MCKLKTTKMKNAIIIGIITVVILAIILGLQAFAWVFSIVINYGIPALVIALVIFAYFKFRGRNRDRDDKEKTTP